MADKEPSKNPFITFKNEVDRHVALTLQGLLGIPSMVSRTFDLALRGSEPIHTGPPMAATRPPQDSQPQQQWPDRTSPYVTNTGGFGPTRRQTADERLISDWLAFARDSEYSPIYLRRLPRQPRPSGLPSYASTLSGGLAPLTFEDAFEDLLCVASGRPMPDIHSRLAMRRMLRSMYPEHPFALGAGGEPYRAWVRRLRTQGLLGIDQDRLGRSDGSFGGSGGRNGATAYDGEAIAAFPGTVESWRYGSKAFDKSTGRYVWEDDRDVAGERQATWPVAGPMPDGGLFERLDALFKAISGIDAGTSGDSSSNKRDKWRDLPDTEDALLSSVRSAFEQSEKSLNTFLKLVLGSDMNDVFGTRNLPSTDIVAEAAKAQGPLRSIEEREEHVDDDGTVHRKVTIRKVNEKGEEVSKETVYTARWSSSGEDTVQKESEGQGQNRGDSKRRGWFWR